MSKLKKILVELKFRAFLVRKALCRSFGLYEINQSELPRNIVISPGGVGTTFLMTHLSGYIDLNDPDDKDWLKHLPTLPKRLSGQKVLYIYGDTTQILSSLRRRGYDRIQSAKLGCVLCQLLPQRLLSERLGRVVQNQMSHFQQCNTPSVFKIRYDDIWDSKDTIAAFFEIGCPTFLTNFPPKKKRLTVK